MSKATTHALTDVRKFLTSGSGCDQSPPFRRPRDQKKRRALGTRMVLGRLQEVNLHNQACARELSSHLPAVLASLRTSFHPICRRIENVSILRLFLLEKMFQSTLSSVILTRMFIRFAFFVTVA